MYTLLSEEIVFTTALNFMKLIYADLILVLTVIMYNNWIARLSSYKNKTVSEPSLPSNCNRGLLANSYYTVVTTKKTRNAQPLLYR